MASTDANPDLRCARHDCPEPLPEPWARGCPCRLPPIWAVQANGRNGAKGRHCNRWKQTAAMGPESGRPAGQKILNSAHLESRSRLHLAGDKSLIDLAYQATAGSFPHLCVGKFAQAAIGNPLKMIDVGSPPGAFDPRLEFRNFARNGPLRLRGRGGVAGKPPLPSALGRTGEGPAVAVAARRTGWPPWPRLTPSGPCLCSLICASCVAHRLRRLSRRS